jgi:hypothetical protein
MNESAMIRAVKMPETEYKFTAWDNFKFWLEEKWPFNSYLYVSSYEDYRKTDFMERTVWGIFYRDHILIREGKDFLGEMLSKSRKKEDEAIKMYKMQKWPVQYYFRETLGLSVFRIKDWWYNKVSARLRPRQKWLTDAVPKTWSDKTWLIPEINFLMVVDFVDGEKCFENTEYSGSEVTEKFAKELKECYNYIKKERPSLQKDLENSYPDEDTSTGNYKKDYAEVNRIEKLLDQKDTKYLTWIVVNRDRMWT